MARESHPYRTHHCDLVKVGEKVKLCGWVDRKRDHGSLLFIDLRDCRGVLQLVFTPQLNDFAQVDGISTESVIVVLGDVVKRSEENFNPNIKNGDLEVMVDTWHVESRCGGLPFPIQGDENVSDELRLKYRFLDLRRVRLRDNILLRSKAMHHLRAKMYDLGFHEFNTPILTASSPEGARDYLVPSRNFPGSFYALPQAPQQFKQLLMIAGFERYFQLAPCFRDEDSRANRSPGDFYQLDLEMSCATQEQIFEVVEEVVGGLFAEFANCTNTRDFRRITYQEAMLRYGSDKPDLRNPLSLFDVTEAFRDSGFQIFSKGVAQGKVVRALPCSAAIDMPRSFFDKAIDYSKTVGAQGLAYVQIDGGGKLAKGPVAKFFDEITLDKLVNLLPGECQNGSSMIFFICDFCDRANDVSGKIRDYLAAELHLLSDGFEFCWVVDFPYFKRVHPGEGLTFFHNPFSMPKVSGIDELADATAEGLLRIDAYQYDLVCNGVEIASGAIRNHKPAMLKKALSLVGYSEEEMMASFGGLLRALEYGAPPHGGIAPGLERILMLIAGEENIREVTCFPLSQRGEDLLMGAPAPVKASHLKELGLAIKKT